MRRLIVSGGLVLAVVVAAVAFAVPAMAGNAAVESTP